MAREPIYLTAKGLEKIKQELQYLKDVKRAEIAANMGKAIEDGDLRESAAYDEARMEQSANEVRIADLEEMIYRAQVVEADASDNAAAMIGSSLVLEDTEGQQETYHLVGTHEADIFENRISDESPFGQQLVGRRRGDKIKHRHLEYTVLQIVIE